MSARSRIAWAAATAGVLALGYLAQGTLAASGGTPANKAYVSGSSLEIMSTVATPGNPATLEKELGTAHVKMSNPTDLLLTVSAECALWTNVATQGDDDNEAIARVEVWITIDGKVVPVAADDTGTVDNDDPDKQSSKGHVVFCNRAQRLKTEGFTEDSEQDNVIRLYNRTRTANAFTWGALNVGSGYDSPANGNNILDIVVHARLVAKVGSSMAAQTVDNPAAKAAVGKRTLVVEPTKMAHNATL